MDNKSPIQYSFIGEVSDPFCSPRITKGLVEFSVRATKTSPFVPEKGAELIDQDGHSYPVTIRSVGRITPDPALDKWQPDDFLIRVDGITMDQASRMRQIRQAQ
jgi:hypothetical protein